MTIWTTLRMVPTVLGLIFRAPGWALNYTLQYRRAKKQFKQHLIEQGVPKDEAKELAECFPFKLGDLIETATDIP